MGGERAAKENRGAYVQKNAFFLEEPITGLVKVRMDRDVGLIISKSTLRILMLNTRKGEKVDIGKVCVYLTPRSSIMTRKQL